MNHSKDVYSAVVGLRYLVLRSRVDVAACLFCLIGFVLKSGRWTSRISAVGSHAIYVGISIFLCSTAPPLSSYLSYCTHSRSYHYLVDMPSWSSLCLWLTWSSSLVLPADAFSASTFVGCRVGGWGNRLSSSTTTRSSSCQLQMNLLPGQVSKKVIVTGAGKGLIRYENLFKYNGVIILISCIYSYLFNNFNSWADGIISLLPPRCRPSLRCCWSRPFRIQC